MLNSHATQPLKRLEKSQKEINLPMELLGWTNPFVLQQFWRGGKQMAHEIARTML